MDDISREEKAEQALEHYLKTGGCIDSDRIRRKIGMGSIRKRKTETISSWYMKNKKRRTKTLDTVEQCEEWLKTELKLVI